MRVAIVGAGINGLYLARKLAERKHKVTVFEKREKIGKECCSGLFSERILEFIPESRKLVQNKIEYCLIHFPRKTLKIKFLTNFLVMSHFDLDRLAAALAEKSGVKIVLKCNISKSDSDTLKNKFDRVIGCDGAASFVRKSLKLKDPYFYLGIQGFISQVDSSDFVETWPQKQGFIWKIPRGEETEYGIIERPEKAKVIFEEFLKEKKLSLGKAKSALIPQGLAVPQVRKITLCGDAAGLTKPWSGGGVVWGLVAADLLLKNFPDFLKYQKELKKFFLPKIIFSKIIKKVAYFSGFKTPWLLPKEFKIESDFLYG